MLKPVDLQVMLPRSLDVQKIQEVHQNRPNLAHHDFARELLHQTQQRQEQVQKSSPFEEGNTIRRDHPGNEKKRQPKYGRFRDRSKKQTETEELLVDTERGQHIDIKV